MTPSAARWRTRTVASCAAIGVLVHTLLPASAAAGPSVVKQHPRPRQVLVVTANLEEIWNERDNADDTDLKAFVRRLGVVAPHAPDVLLVQEVTRRATKRLAKLLETKTSHRYTIAVAAGKHPVVVKKDRVVTRETAILINARTMKRVGKPRYIDTTYKKGHGAKGLDREVKRNAAALLRERRSGMTFPMASVHFHTRAQLRTDRLNRYYRNVWSKRVSKMLKKTWSRNAHKTVIGGDINEARHLRSRDKSKIQRWWKSLARRGFRDTINEVKPHGGVDYIFTRTRIAGAAVDSSYNPRKVAGTSSYYSDHKLRWALLGIWRPTIRARPKNSSVATISWKRLPSVKKYIIQRSGPGSKGWTLARKVGGRRSSINDFRLKPLTRYRYRVIAWNGAERSMPSRVNFVHTKRDTLGPRQPTELRVGVKKSSLGAARLRWKRTRDRGGSGVKGYEIWRTDLGRDPKLIKTTPNPWYIDRKFPSSGTLEYRIVAYDRVGNRSVRSEPATVVPKIKKGRPN